MAWISARLTPLEPMWRAWITAVASLAGSWLVVHFWTTSRGAEHIALLFFGPIYYIIVAGIVTAILSIVLPRIEAPVVRVAIIAACFAVMGFSRGGLSLWEVLLAAILALLHYLDLSRHVRDERDLRDLL